MDRMQRIRRIVLTVATLWVAVAAGGCADIAPSGFGGDAEALLARGEAYAGYLVRQPAEELSDEEILALGYLERARQGLGSPFRLVDYVLRDPDLSPELRERLAYAILSRVLDQRTYEVPPVVLEGVSLFGVPPHRRVGESQLDLIERTVAAAPTATSGERAVRLGYRLAAAERTAGGVPHSLVAHASALVADRRRAAEDAQLLLRTAARDGADPLVMLPRWRREMLFRVERPALTVPLTVREEAAVARHGPQFARALRALALRLTAPTSLVPGAGAPDPRIERSLLSTDAAQRLLSLAKRRDYPAQAPIAVAAAVARKDFFARPDLAEWEREARADFLDLARNEEKLVAGAHLLRASGAAPVARLAALEIYAAVFLRAWNQEEPWFPGDPAPAAKDLVGRFGLAAVEIDAEVPKSWRPYYLRMLAHALTDLQRVLPTAAARGLTIRIGPLAPESRALALHDPRSRTLHLPPQTGAGTLAHEIAHDLDWQLARIRYGKRGGYATDLAVRGNRGDRLAASLDGLVAALARTNGDSLASAHDTRPAEVFARGTDWLVATALAREGRTGGYLSTFQDATLTGHGTTRGPDFGGAAVPALLSILGAIAPAADSTRIWILQTYGPTRTPAPSDIANAILAAGSDRPPAERFLAISEAREKTLSALGSASCRLSSTEGLRRLVTAQRRLIEESTRAAARGAAVEAIRELAAARLGSDALATADGWLAWRLHGAPEPVDTALVELAPAFEDLLYTARAVQRTDPGPVTSAFDAGGTATLCGGNPFMAAAESPFHAPRATPWSGIADPRYTARTSPAR